MHDVAFQPHARRLSDSILRAAIAALLAGSGASAYAAPASASASASASAALDDIVVTARRREESQIEVPISIALVSGDLLAESSITRTQDLQYLVPGLSVVTFLGGANVSLRGVGTGQNVSGADESVGVYIDDVYQGTTSSSFSRMFDVERVEVLKGPQGTLYGRNVTAGAINVISRAPRLGEFSGSADASYGSYSTVRVNAALNVPLGERTAFRFAATGANGDGYVRNVDTGRTQNGEDYVGARLRLRSELTERLTIDASVQYLDDQTPVVFETLPFEPNFLGFQRTRAPEQFNSNSQKVLNSVLRVDYELNDEWLLRSITGYMDLKNEHRFSGPASTPTPLVDGATQVDRPEYEQFSQEVQFQWTRGRNSATAGLYYLDSTLTNQRQICFCVFGLDNYQNAVDRGPVDAWAVFGEAEIGLTDSVSLIAGLRYGDETRKLHTQAGDPPGLTDPVAPYGGEASFGATTGRLGLRWQPSPGTSVYATASRGFKAGGVQSLPTDPPEVGRFEPEHLDAYEIGVKHAIGSRGLVEAAVFHYKYDDLQVFQVKTLFDFQIVNAPSATIKGVDVNGDLRFGEYFGAGASLGYLDATYDRFVLKTAGGVDVDLSGERLARSPEWSAAANLRVENVPVLRWLGSLRAEVNYRDRVISVPDSPQRMAAASLPGVTLLNLVARLDPAEDKGLGFFLNLRNLGDREYYEFNGGGGLIGGQSSPGRTYEVGLSYRF